MFAPLEKIGLIVIDEEQEGAYASQQSPRYHARDIARARCHRHQALLLLASATPSVETFYQAQRGRIRLYTPDPSVSGGTSCRRCRLSIPPKAMALTSARS